MFRNDACIEFQHYFHSTKVLHQRHLLHARSSRSILYQAGMPGNTPTHHLISKSHLPAFEEFRNFSFPGRSLTRLFPVVTRTFSGSKPLFPDPETNLFPGARKRLFLSRKQTFCPRVSLFPPPPPPKPARPRVSK